MAAGASGVAGAVPGRGGWMPWALALAAVAAGLAILLPGGPAAWSGLPLDDAWIHQVYGRAVAASGLLEYDDGVPAAGATSPLWAVLLGLVHLATGDTSRVLLLTRALGLSFHALSAVLLGRMVRRASSSPVAGLLAGLLLAFSPPMAMAAVSGMEVSLACALLLLALDRAMDGRSLAAGTCLGLAGLARPELGLAGLIVAIDLGIQVARGRARPREIPKLLGPMVALGAAFLLWNLHATGRPFPGPFYEKAGVGALLPLFDRVARGAAILTADPPLWSGSLLLGVLAAALGRGRVPRGTGLALAVGLGHALASVALIAPLDVESFYFQRYLLPAVPPLCLALALPVSAQAASAWRERSSPGTSLARRAFAALAPLLVLATLGLGVAGLPALAARHATWCRNIDDVQATLGRLIDQRLPGDAVVGATDAGAVRYFGRRTTVDLMGLNTPRPQDAIPPGPRLDVLAIMPAWMSMTPSPRLVLLSRARAEGYAISTNRLFAVQVMLGCATDDTGDTMDLPVTILGRAQTLPLRCHDRQTLAAWSTEPPSAPPP